MKDKEYKDAWDEMKLDVMIDYARLKHTEETPDNIETLAGRIEQLKDIGKYMDLKDGTNEFSNLLSDLGDE
ncbi:hypothetical protein AB6E71_05415 [Staphylococcus arlettae]|uniref:hypothetical protein n=1 Tax=Staphylococcus arlettae TaxID=29378 RepID=UPI0034DCFBCE